MANAAATPEPRSFGRWRSGIERQEAARSLGLSYTSLELPSTSREQRVRPGRVWANLSLSPRTRRNRQIGVFPVVATLPLLVFLAATRVVSIYMVRHFI